MNNFNIENLSGRVIVLNEENEKYIDLDRNVTIVPAISDKVCNRCFGHDFGYINKFKYCRKCISFGRIDENDKLIKFKNIYNPNIKNDYLLWDGQLSEYQKIVSNELCENVFNFKNHLLWAVTGAGKTEILFKTINKILSQGKRIALVSPRVDVCEELFPRFSEAFNITINLMHGKKEDKYENTSFLISTVHQLIKFENTFDVIIVDEVDSYPLFNNDWLNNIIFKALKSNGRLIYLSATPPKNILSTVEKIYYLPIRFHGMPLPVPQLKILNFKSKIIKKINHLYTENQRFILFFPSIDSMNKFVNKNKNEFKFNYKSVSSKNIDRLDIIKNLEITNYLHFLLRQFLNVELLLKILMY